MASSCRRGKAGAPIQVDQTVPSGQPCVGVSIDFRPSVRERLWSEATMGVWDFVLAGLIGLIDLNPLLDLVFTPLAWAITFWRG